MTSTNFWDEGAHQPHAPRNPNPLAVFALLAVFGLILLALAVRS